MLFVLAAMLLLMSIGVSALTAAGANYGARVTKQTENQLALLMNSMELTLREALDDPDLRELIIQNAFDGDFDPIQLTSSYIPVMWNIELLIDNNVFRNEGRISNIITEPVTGCGCAASHLPGEGESGCASYEAAAPPVWRVTRWINISGRVSIGVGAQHRALTAGSITTYNFTGRLEGESADTATYDDSAIVIPDNAMEIVDTGGTWTFRRRD
jgi:hypothetical protein